MYTRKAFSPHYIKRIFQELPAYLGVLRETVHDSGGFYIRNEDIHTIVPVLIEICSNPNTEELFGFKTKYVNMKVEASIGDNWAELEDYNPNKDYTV